MKYKLLSTLFLFTIIGTFNNPQAQIKSNFKTSNQKTKTFNNPWQFSSEPDSKTLKQKSQIRQIIPEVYKTATVDLKEFKTYLNQAPKRFSVEASQNKIIINLPMPDGTFEQFEIQESSVMHPDLAAKFPQIKSYSGQGIDDPSASLSGDISHKGFHAVIRSGKHSTVYIDPYAMGNTKDYIIYYRKDLKNDSPSEHFCLNDEIDHPQIEKQKEDFSNLEKMVSNCQLRTYRLAVAATGEYTAFHGGTVAGGMAAINTLVSDINSIWERDFAIHFELVANNNQLIYTNAATDPYTNSSFATMLGENQTNCDMVIGSANYDIGHVLSTSAGGLAFLSIVCNSNYKAQGVSGYQNPIGAFLEYIFLHEIGHQFGAVHTQNNSCVRDLSSSVEPGSGSTIMSYAGACAPNIQNNADDYYHGFSISQIKNNLINASTGNCATVTTISNNAPTINPDLNYAIPGGTKFMLAADANDVNGNNSLTYSWEQINTEPGTMPPLGTNAVGPMFRSLPPSTDSIRYFPNITAIVNNVQPTWEVLPTVDRSMDFRVTVRDNFQGSGCTVQDDVNIIVDGDSGPFTLTAPNIATSWNADATETVTWNVANTTNAPIFCSFVDILLSTDGGLTYPITLASQVPNDGQQDVIVPYHPTTTARVMVKAYKSIFFDISNQNFTITGTENDYFLSEQRQEISSCQPQTIYYDLTIAASGTFSGMISLTASGLPSGVTASFTPNSINTSGTSVLSFQNLNLLAPGNYPITISASHFDPTTGMIIKQKSKQVNIHILEPLTLSIDSWINAASGNNGSVDISFNGGTPPYQYAWSNGATNQNNTQLPVGTHSITLTDAHNCSVSDSIMLYDRNISLHVNADKAFARPGDTITYNITVSSILGITLNNVSVSNVLPNNTSYISGGILNQDTVSFSSISLAPLQSTSLTFKVRVNDNVPIGTTIINSAQATDGISSTIVYTSTFYARTKIVATLLHFDLVLTEAACSGDSSIVTLVITGGTGPYSAVLNHSQPMFSLSPTIAFPVLPGTNYFAVFDTADYQFFDDSIIVPDLNPLDLNFTVTNMNGGNNGVIDLSISGGVSPFTFTWSNGANTQNLSGLAAGDYTVTVTDANNCMKSDTTTIFDDTCYDNQLTLNILMGDPTFSLQWFVQDLNGGTVLQGYGQFEDIICLPNGCYTFSMLDVNGTFCCDQGTDCCDSDIGDYFLINNTNGDTIFMSNGQFQSFESTFFCINDLPTISYCSSSASSQLFEWIETVQIGSINQTSGESGGYADFTSLYTVAHIGDTVSLSLTPGFRYGPYDEHWMVWVDYNRDGDFLDPNEEVFSAFGQSTVAGSFIIPDNVVVSDLRMRVSMQYNTSPSSCEAFSYGEVEDYTLVIASSPSNPFQNDTPTALQVNSDVKDSIEKKVEENQRELVEKTNLKVYPNPVKNILQIDITLPKNTEGNLIITDINGSIIQHSQIISSTESRQLNVQNLALGVYFVHLLSDQSKITEKFIVIR